MITESIIINIIKDIMHRTNREYTSGSYLMKNEAVFVVYHNALISMYIASEANITLVSRNMHMSL